MLSLQQVNNPTLRSRRFAPFVSFRVYDSRYSPLSIAAILFGPLFASSMLPASTDRTASLKATHTR